VLLKFKLSLSFLHLLSWSIWFNQVSSEDRVESIFKQQMVSLRPHLSQIATQFFVHLEFVFSLLILESSKILCLADDSSLLLGLNLHNLFLLSFHDPPFDVLILIEFLLDQVVNSFNVFLKPSFLIGLTNCLSFQLFRLVFVSLNWRLYVQSVHWLVYSQGLVHVNFFLAAVYLRFLRNYFVLSLFCYFDLKAIGNWFQGFQLLESVLYLLLLLNSKLFEQRLMVLGAWVVALASLWDDDAFDIDHFSLCKPLFELVELFAGHLVWSWPQVLKLTHFSYLVEVTVWNLLLFGQSF
jgi:hypothetical protein